MLIRKNYDETYNSYINRLKVHTGYIYSINDKIDYLNDFSYKNLFKEDNNYNENNYNVFLKSTIHYCYYCLKEQIDKIGECYFKRSHQIIGVKYCYIHNTKLSNSNIKSINATDFYYNHNLEIEKSNYNEYEIKVAKLIDELLNSNINLKYYDFNKIYKKIIERKRNYSFYNLIDDLYNKLDRKTFYLYFDDNYSIEKEKFYIEKLAPLAHVYILAILDITSEELLSYALLINS